MACSLPPAQKQFTLIARSNWPDPLARNRIPLFAAATMGSAMPKKIEWTPRTVARWLLDSEMGPDDRFIARWIVLRALGLIYFSAFFSLVFQIRGLIGPDGILPANHYL